MRKVPVTHDFYRSQNGVLAGVCQGLAEKFQIPPWLVRLIWVASVLFVGTGLLMYLVLAFVLPREGHPEDAEKSIFLGVCRELSIRFQWDVVLVRVIASLLALTSLGAAVVIYVGLYFLLPQMKDSNDSSNTIIDV